MEIKKEVAERIRERIKSKDYIPGLKRFLKDIELYLQKVAETLVGFVKKWPYERQMQETLNANGYREKEKLMTKHIYTNFTKVDLPFIHAHENIIDILRHNGWFEIADALNVYRRHRFTNPIRNFDLSLLTYSYLGTWLLTSF